ncbi:MAG: autotransporter domain-containing protein, partial [Candidatus Neptunochlamydia sp.]|nr:autotransporter domain-containing protein [Candidatus Neptunochlamydia sp.]
DVYKRQGGGGTTRSGSSNIGINGGSGGPSCGGGGGGGINGGTGGGSDSCGSPGGNGSGFAAGIGGNGGTDNVTGIGGGGGGSGGAYPSVSTNAGNGGFGGGGGGLGDGNQNNPIQSAGDGGFGGGGGSSSWRGNAGHGGFGGGGGGSYEGAGGNGGFGGGGAPGAISDGTSPFGGGTSSNDNGAGGGAAFGGSIIIHNGGHLTLTNPQITGSNIQEGTRTPGTSAGNGMALGKEIFLMSGGTLTFNISSETFTLPSPIESDRGAGGGTGGGVIKTGAGTLDLSSVGTQTYTGSTVIQEGLIRMSADDNFGPLTNAVFINGGGIYPNSSFTSTARPIQITSSGIIRVDNGNSFTVATTISGVGSSLEKRGQGILNLGGVNTYAGESTVNGGVLRLVGRGTLGNGGDLDLVGGGFEIAAGAGTKTIRALRGGGTGIDLNNNTLRIANGSYSGVISGSGGITKYSTGTLDLSGANIYTGTTTLADGIVNIDGSHNFGGGGDLIFNGGTLNTTGDFAINNPTNMVGTGTFSIATGTLTHHGVISGAGDLNKMGVGTLYMTTSSPYTGALTVQQGTLIVGSTFPCPIIIDPGALLISGNGTIGSLQNNGTVVPGASIGVLTINGDYTQSNQASLVIEIDDVPTVSDKLLITGQANLDGTIILNPLPGSYVAGTTYTFIESNSVNGQFDTLLETHPLDFLLNYTSNGVQIIIPFSETVLPVPIDVISGNAKNIAKYLFSCKQLPSPDLIPILRTLVKLPPEKFTEALLKLGPEQFGALALGHLQTSTRIGQSMNRAKSFYEDYYLTPCYPTFNPPSYSNHMIWIAPIGYYYKQNERDEQVPFENRTYGFTTGVDHCFSNHFVLSGGFGYTHSNLNWKQNRGCSHIQSIYLGPSIGYISPQGYIGLSLVGSRSSYDVKRRIAFSSFKETAENHHKSWDLLAEINGSIKLKLPEILNKNLFMISSVTIDYLNIFESGYQESGAGPIDLSVKNVHSTFVRPEVTVRLMKELTVHLLCASPSIYMGWQKNIPLTQSYYTSSFYKQEVCSKNFTVKSYHSSTDQLVLGTDLIIMGCKANWSLKVGYKASICDHFNTQEGTLNFNWNW